MGSFLMTGSNRLPAGNSAIWPVVGIALLLCAQATMVFTRTINWDEFFYYSQVHQFLRGDLLPPLQTIHVRFFAWLPAVAKNPVDAIVIARVFMFACEIVTIAMIATIARRFTDAAGAWLAALCYVSAGFVLQHGFSFRVDPSTTVLLMGALAILARARLGIAAIAAFAFLTALAGMFTIKIVLFAPAFAGLAWMRWAETGHSRVMAMRLVGAAILTLALFALLYLYHSHGLAAAGDAATVQSKAEVVVTSSGEAVFFLGIPPYWNMMAKAASLSLVFTLLILLAPFALWRGDRAAPEKIALLGLWLPVLTLAFYRNTAPYYYAFMLAPVAAGCVPALQLALKRFSPAMLTGALVLLTLPVLSGEDRETIDNQRTVIGTASAMFDEPVAYFDHNGALAGYRKANGFMTPWGLEGYRAHGKSQFRTVMEQRTVPLLFENDQLLVDLLDGHDESTTLFPEDSRVLRDNYVRVWGPIWLAGKDAPAGSRVEAEVLVPGRYRIEGAVLSIDGTEMPEGSVVTLDRGSHLLSNASADNARLVWADVDRIPQGPVPEGRLWIGF